MKNYSFQTLVTENEIPQRDKVQTSKELASLFQDIYKEDAKESDFLEYAFLIGFRGPCKPVGYRLLSIGGLSGTVMDIRVVAATALEMGATAIALCHNHPSGSIESSHADRAVTKKVKKAMDLFDINLLDHIILTPGADYLSMSDQGLI